MFCGGKKSDEGSDCNEHYSCWLSAESVAFESDVMMRMMVGGSVRRQR